MDELEPADALAQLRRGECDVALVYEYIRDGMPTRTFETEEGEPAVPLLDELIWLALPKDHPNVSMRYAALSDFVDARWIAGCITCRSNLMELCSEAGFTPDIHFVTDDYIALQRLVKEGLGIALLPDLMVLNGESNDFVVRPFEPRCFRRVFAVTTSSHMTVPAVAATIEMLRRTSSELRPRRTY
jgi:DNA-binding transcriptional LysR family regulator